MLNLDTGAQVSSCKPLEINSCVNPYNITSLEPIPSKLERNCVPQIQLFDAQNYHRGEPSIGGIQPALSTNTGSRARQASERARYQQLIIADIRA